MQTIYVKKSSMNKNDWNGFFVGEKVNKKNCFSVGSVNEKRVGKEKETSEWKQS